MPGAAALRVWPPSPRLFGTPPYINGRTNTHAGVTHTRELTHAIVLRQETTKAQADWLQVASSSSTHG